MVSSKADNSHSHMPCIPCNLTERQLGKQGRVQGSQSLPDGCTSAVNMRAVNCREGGEIGLCHYSPLLRKCLLVLRPQSLGEHLIVNWIAAGTFLIWAGAGKLPGPMTKRTLYAVFIQIVGTMFEVCLCGPDMWYFTTRMRGLTAATALETHLGLWLQYYVGQHIQEVTTVLRNIEASKGGGALWSIRCPKGEKSIG